MANPRHRRGQGYDPKGQHRAFVRLLLLVGMVAVSCASAMTAEEAPGETKAPTAEKEIAQLLASDNKDQVQEGIIQIVTNELTDFRKTLAQLAVEHKEIEVRRLALLALLRLEEMDLPPARKAELAEKRLQVALGLRSETAEIRQDAVRLIKEYALREFTSELGRLAENDKGPGVRRDATEALSKFARDIIKPFEARLREQVENAAEQQVLQRLYEEFVQYAKTHEKEVMQKLATGTPAEKTQAVMAVKAGHLSHCLPLIREMMLHEMGQAGVEACEVIRHWKGTKEEEYANLEAYREGLKGNESTRAGCAAELAERRRDKEAIGVLISCLRSEREEVRDLAFATLVTVTDQHFGTFPRNQSAEEVIRRWERWWDQSKDSFK